MGVSGLKTNVQQQGMHRVVSSRQITRSFFWNQRSLLLAGVALLGLAPVALAQQQPTVPVPAPVTTTNDDGTIKTTTSTTTDSSGRTEQSVSTGITLGSKKKKDVIKEDKIIQSKDTKKELKKEKTADALIGVDSKLPDKQLYDKAVYALKHGHFDVARLDLQTMLNTYPDSQYQMRAKLAIADSWYKEGGTAALTQAESEYADFRVFFPNAPEAAEAQMRIGDIYFRQMDKPDRDYSKSIHAEEEYRRMLTDYPDSELIPQAKQRLREVQETLATRESDIGAFYSTHANWPATIARYQTVIDTYPLYSHMDDVLIGLGDAFEAQSRFVRSQTNIPEGPKAKLEAYFDNQAADAYRKVVLEHSATLHAEDAKERLVAMNQPIPVPTAEQMAASAKLENSRQTYRLSDRAKLIILHQPDTVLASRVGDPLLADPKATVAPSIVTSVQKEYVAAMTPAAAPSSAPALPAAEAAIPAPAAPLAPAVPGAPLAFQDVPSSADAGGPSPDLSAPAASARPATGAGGGVGIEVISTPKTRADSANYGLKASTPANADAALPPVEAAAPAPDRANEITGPTAPAQQVDGSGKTPKPAFDKQDESSSKHKPKKGIKKVIPPNPL